VLSTSYVPAIGHSWGDWYVTTPVDFGRAGEEARICANNATHKETRVIPAIKIVYLDGNRYVAGDLLLGMKYGVWLTKEVLSDREMLAALFPGVEIKQVNGPYNFERQLIHLVLAYDNLEYMLDAKKTLEQNFLVEYVEFNGIISIAGDDSSW
jgi:hypothetical protein